MSCSHSFPDNGNTPPDAVGDSAIGLYEDGSLCCVLCNERWVPASKLITEREEREKYQRWFYEKFGTQLEAEDHRDSTEQLAGRLSDRVKELETRLDSITTTLRRWHDEWRIGPYQPIGNSARREIAALINHQPDTNPVVSGETVPPQHSTYAAEPDQCLPWCKACEFMRLRPRAVERR